MGHIQYVKFFTCGENVFGIPTGGKKKGFRDQLKVYFILVILFNKLHFVDSFLI